MNKYIPAYYSPINALVPVYMALEERVIPCHSALVGKYL